MNSKYFVEAHSRILFEFSLPHDSISRPLMALAWNRLGVPSAVAHWLAYMNDGGTIMVRTPLAMRQYGSQTSFPPHPSAPGFSGDLGTPQSGVSGPAA